MKNAPLSSLCNFINYFKPDGKEESTDEVTVTAKYIKYPKVGKPVDCLNCAGRVIIAKLSFNFLCMFFLFHTTL